MGEGLTEGSTASLRNAVDRLLAADLARLSSVEVTAVVTELEVQRRRLTAVEHELTAELNERAIAGDYARASTADLLVTLLRVSPAEAKVRVIQAGDLGPRRAVSGEPLPPVLPAVAASIRAGEISSQHVAVIARCIERIPADIAHEAAPPVERFLVEAARHEHPKALARTAELLLNRLDPDGREPRDGEIERRRDFTMHSRPDGSADVRGLLTAETAETLRTVLDTLSAPVPAAEGMRDDRTPGQRRHDALHDMATRLLRAGDLPTAGGAPTTVIVTTTAAELRAGSGMAQTAHGDVWTIGTLQLSACDADVVPVVFNDAGGIVAYGRTRRLASRGQRLALIARDGGCCFPECDRPASWAEVHHIEAWADGGSTDLDNMCVLCRFHHREFERRDWRVEMSTDSVPEWIPPPFIDPQRRPQRNRAHHLTEFDFRTAGPGSAVAG
ncbi:MAG: DUF222 domain-containing protein [Jatrophihabitans sp.]